MMTTGTPCGDAVWPVPAVAHKTLLVVGRRDHLRVSDPETLGERSG